MWCKQEQWTRVTIVGDSQMKRYPLEYFPRKYLTNTTSYHAHAVHFADLDIIRYTINARTQPDVIIISLGGNDIAYIQGREARRRKPTDEEIVRSLKQIIRAIHYKNIIPIMLPIPPRSNTKQEISHTTPDEFKTRARNINLKIEKDILQELGYNIFPYNPRTNWNLEKDGIHLSRESYKEITKKIVEHIQELRHIKYNIADMREHKKVVRKRIRREDEDKDDQERTEKRRSSVNKEMRVKNRKSEDTAEREGKSENKEVRKHLEKNE